MASKLVWDGKSRKGDAVIEDLNPMISDLYLTVSGAQGGNTIIDIERDGDWVSIDKGDAIELVKYLTTMIPTMKQDNL
ncbi:hypothetical protein CPT_Metamorpho_195 [Klebsiella phage Metamorpho]|nr:hypothetical protein CPT_Metamorpho_195 [Klebsiella phage Metamorpho]